MNYYEHHIGDYAQATAHLTFVEDAAYSRLIRKYYAEERPLPAELPAVQRLVGARTREEKSAVKTVLEEFFFLDEDGWHNKRADAEIERYREKSSKAAASARVRWDKSQSSGNANAMRTHTERNANERVLDANQEPRTKNQIKKATTVATPEGVSSEVWESFVQHRKAKKAPITSLVMQSIEEQAKLAGWTLENALKEACVRGWQSFKAEWVARRFEPQTQLTAAERLKRMAG